jgi:hypothetical protein
MNHLDQHLLLCLIAGGTGSKHRTKRGYRPEQLHDCMEDYHD